MAKATDRARSAPLINEVSLSGPAGVPLRVTARSELASENSFDTIVDRLDRHLGMALASNYEYPSRYSLWNFGFTDPLIVFEARLNRFTLRAFSERGRGLLNYLRDALAADRSCRLNDGEDLRIAGEIEPETEALAEERRTRKRSIFTAIRTIWRALSHPDLPGFGLYGAFGYDLIFAFEDLETRMARDARQRDIVLFVPDTVFKSTVGERTGTTTRFDFAYRGHRSENHPRTDCLAPFVADPGLSSEIRADHQPGEYERTVSRAREEFIQGNLFEAVPGQSFFAGMRQAPAKVFGRMMRSNPSPFGFLVNLGDGEFLIGASPEMYVRTDGSMVETCPISGTIPRGADPMEDAAQILKLLSSSKDEAELTMCTDVDRNDKARICIPGSVRVKGRRQIEMYSRLIHTVDHVTGELAEGYDGLDAFISHMWAVTVTGAPKRWAVRFLEHHEKSPRRWYAGAVGGLLADGTINTALAIRMVQVRDGLAEVRAGATTLYHSDPAAEERETRLKASAFLAALVEADRPKAGAASTAGPAGYRQRALRIMLVDHEDSFVHMLGNYFKMFEPALETYRSGPARSKLNRDFDLVVMSPGPGRPRDFDTAATLAIAMKLGIPVFGVCLGLQAVNEYFGGELGILDIPCHGIPARVRHDGSGIFRGLPEEFEAARYHSLFACEKALPGDLRVTARSADGVVMGLRHASAPIQAVQFHPESIISTKANAGLRLVRNVLEDCAAAGRTHPRP